MKTISIHSHKGGAGKTTLALMIAKRLATAGRKVCVVDLDFLAAGIYPAIRAEQPKACLDELLLSAPGSSRMPQIQDLIGRHGFGPDTPPLGLVLNAGERWPAAPGKDDPNHLRDHQGTVRLLNLEEQTGIVQRHLARLIEELEGQGYEYVILDCHPTLEEISETVLRLQMDRPLEDAATVLVSTPDRAHLYGLLKELNHRSKNPKGATLRLENTVLAVNGVQEKPAGRPYGSTLDSFAALAEELRRDPVVLDEAPALVSRLRPDHYCRILRHGTLSPAFAVGSGGDIPDFPPATVRHSGTPLCIELFGR